MKTQVLTPSDETYALSAEILKAGGLVYDGIVRDHHRAVEPRSGNGHDYQLQAGRDEIEGL